MRFSNRLLPAFLLAFSFLNPVAATVPDSPASQLTHFSVGALLSPSVRGGQAEVTFGNRFPVQLQIYEYEEFQGIFPSVTRYPYEDFTAFSLTGGYYVKGYRTKLGVLSGLTYVDGTLRGDFLREEEAACGFFSCSDDKDRYYEPERAKTVLVPLRILGGFNVGMVGVTLGPQWLLGKDKAITTLLLGVEVGVL